MTTRQSARLAAKKGRLQNEGETHGEVNDHNLGRRVSVGGALGLTPARPKGRNLAVAKAASAAEAAAARLDELNAGDQQVSRKRAKRKSSKARKARSRRRQKAEPSATEATAYEARSRESIALLQQTEQLFGVGEMKREEGAESPPGLVSLSDESDEAGASVDTESSGPATSDEENEGMTETSVIATPGVPPVPTKSDEEFIAPSEEEGQTPAHAGDTDPDYDPSMDGPRWHGRGRGRGG